MFCFKDNVPGFSPAGEDGLDLECEPTVDTVSNNRLMLRWSRLERGLRSLQTSGMLLSILLHPISKGDPDMKQSPLIVDLQDPKLVKARTGKVISSKPSLPPSEETLTRVTLERIKPNPYQPRRIQNTEHFACLVESVRNQGILEPLVARPESDGSFTLIAGQRRYDAARELGLMDVPVVSRSVNDDKMFLLALIENIQREDLHPVDLVRALDTLAEKLGGQRLAAEAVGMSHDAVRQWLRTRSLGDEVLAQMAKVPDTSRNELLRMLEVPEEDRLAVARQRVIDSKDRKPEVAPPSSITKPHQTTLEIKHDGSRAYRIQIHFFEGSTGSLDEIEKALLEALDRIREQRSFQVAE